MILVTVGTHEDPFDRLITALDDLVEAGQIDEGVLIQRGYSAPARSCESVDLMPYQQLQHAMADARIVVTHGGPASIMQALAAGKVPIVVPRQPAFGEHVDEHQVDFTRRMQDRVVAVYDIADLGPAIDQYDSRIAGLALPTSPRGRADEFGERLEGIIQDLLSGPG